MRALMERSARAGVERRSVFERLGASAEARRSPEARQPPTSRTRCCLYKWTTWSPTFRPRANLVEANLLNASTNTEVSASHADWRAFALNCFQSSPSDEKRTKAEHKPAALSGSITNPLTVEVTKSVAPQHLEMTTGTPAAS